VIAVISGNHINPDVAAVLFIQDDAVPQMSNQVTGK
jgi:hypothetical protein